MWVLPTAVWEVSKNPMNLPHFQCKHTILTAKVPLLKQETTHGHFTATLTIDVHAHSVNNNLVCHVSWPLSKVNDSCKIIKYDTSEANSSACHSSQH